MAKISLQKNEKINLTKESDKLVKVRAELGWQSPENVFPKFDLDVSCFMLNDNAKLISEEGLIFYNNEQSPDFSVIKTPDEHAGGTESLIIDIEKLNSIVKELSIIVTIHKAEQRNHSFKDVSNAYMNIYNDGSGDIIAKFNLSDIAPNSTAIQVGSFYSTEEGFTFQGVGQGYTLGLQEFIEGYS